MKNRSFRKLVSSLLIVVMLFGSVGVAFGASTTDIAGHWAEDRITTWIDKGFINGYEDGSFKPENKITRAEFIALVNRSFGFNEQAPISFSDVPSGHWAYANIAIAVKAGYISGYADGTVGADQSISRQEAAAIVDRLLGLSQASSKAATFSDSSDIASWAKVSIDAVVAKGLMKGYEADNSFKPTKSITRAETVVVLDQAISAKAVVYNTAGTYGPATGIETINSDVEIQVTGVTLRNMVIKGKLLFAAGIGNGDAFLDHVIVTGDTTVSGGGVNSIHFKNSTLAKVIVRKISTSEPVRIVAEGSTTVNQVSISSPTVIEEDGTTGEGFGDVTLSEDLPSGSDVTLKGSFDEITVLGEDANVDFPEGTTVSNFVSDTNTTVTGKGTVDHAELGENSTTTFETKPTTTTTPDGDSTSPSPVNNQEDDSPANKAALTLAIGAATTLQAEQSIRAGAVSTDDQTALASELAAFNTAITAYGSAIAAASAIVDNTAVSQTTVGIATTALGTATTTLNAAILAFDTAETGLITARASLATAITVATSVYVEAQAISVAISVYDQVALGAAWTTFNSAITTHIDAVTAASIVSGSTTASQATLNAALTTLTTATGTINTATGAFLNSGTTLATARILLSSSVTVATAVYIEQQNYTVALSTYDQNALDVALTTFNLAITAYESAVTTANIVNDNTIADLATINAAVAALEIATTTLYTAVDVYNIAVEDLNLAREYFVNEYNLARNMLLDTEIGTDLDQVDSDVYGELSDLISLLGDAPYQNFATTVELNNFTDEIIELKDAFIAAIGPDKSILEVDILDAIEVINAIEVPDLDTAIALDVAFDIFAEAIGDYDSEISSAIEVLLDDTANEAAVAAARTALSNESTAFSDALTVYNTALDTLMTARTDYVDEFNSAVALLEETDIGTEVGQVDFDAYVNLLNLLTDIENELELFATATELNEYIVAIEDEVELFNDAIVQDN